MGGLVNRAAFTTIGSLFSRAARTAAAPAPGPGAVAAATAAAPSPQPTTEKPMENADAQAEIDALKDQVADLQQTIADLTAERDALTAKDAEHREADAKAAVDLAAKEGRIAPAEEVKGKWVKALLADPENAPALLASLPANPAFRAITTPAARAAEGANTGTGVTRLKTALRPA